MKSHGQFCCPMCRQTTEFQIEIAEANSPQGESGATGCSGAGCTQRLEPGVRGPAQILAKVMIDIERRIRFFEVHSPNVGSSPQTIAELKDILNYAMSLLGTEPQDAA